MGARSPLLKAFGDDFAWSLLDAAPDSTLIVSGTGEIVFANEHAGAMFGLGADELLGKVVEDLLPEASRPVHRAHRTRYRADPTVRSMGAGLELRARRNDGSEFPVEISLSPLRLGEEVFAVAAVRDVTDRVAAEDQLHRVIQTLDATDDAVFIFDADTLHFSFVNDGASRLVGYPQIELLSMTPLHLNPYTDEGEYRHLVEQLVAGDNTTHVRRTGLLRKDGTEVPVEKTLRAAPPGRDGHRWIITLARDITARLAAEAELRDSQDALRQAEQDVAIADDRERIARDLHDTVIQRLFAEGLNLQATMQHVDGHARERLEATIDGLDQTIKDLRTAVFSLQRATDASGGLRGQLLDIISDATTSLGFEPRLEFDGPIETIDDDIAEHLLPVLREALSKTTRHADATDVRVTVRVSDHVALTVDDDGKGLPNSPKNGNGLMNMAQRAESLGGDCVITTPPSGSGTLLTWRVPVS